MSEKPLPKMCVMFQDNTKMEITKDNKIILISPDWKLDIVIGDCTIDIKELKEKVAVFSSRLV